MSHFDGKYFSAEGGLSYKNLLQHFKNQAHGKRDISLIEHFTSRGGDAKKRFRQPYVHGSLVLVDLGKPSEVVNTHGEKQPKVEVFDPSEGIRRRALEQVIDERSNKSLDAEGNAQSSAASRKGNTGKRKANLKSGSSSKKSAKSTIKRAKDIFEK